MVLVNHLFKNILRHPGHLQQACQMGQTNRFEYYAGHTQNNYLKYTFPEQKLSSVFIKSLTVNVFKFLAINFDST